MTVDERAYAESAASSREGYMQMGHASRKQNSYFRSFAAVSVFAAKLRDEKAGKGAGAKQHRSCRTSGNNTWGGAVTGVIPIDERQRPTLVIEIDTRRAIHNTSAARLISQCKPTPVLPGLRREWFGQR